jgi:catechol 2,3-dioxygenase-like lactoylglutathione lyase family enzyme
LSWCRVGVRIDQVQFPVPDVPAGAAFFRDVLGLPVDGGLVQVGRSRLRLVPAADAVPATQHLAFSVPGDAGRAAHDWLAQRVELLGHDGEDLFEASPSWDACSSYFLGADGTVLELIARRRLPERLGGDTFGPRHLLAISEVGVPVTSVVEARRRLAREAGSAPFGGPGSETFSAVGDDDGLLVLVAPGRAWFPTRDHLARPSRLVVDLSGTRGRGELALDPGTLVRYA